MIEIIPTVVPASLEDIEKAAERAGALAHALHIDCADGTFAPNMTWLPHGERLIGRGAFMYEAHLMVALPREVGLAAIAIGCSRIIGHIEAMGNTVEHTFAAWRAAGASEVGLGILASTPLEELDPFADMCDVVQMMTIASIGVQGLPFDETASSRVQALHARYPDLLISVDGGVSGKNIADLSRAGASRFCVGSALSNSPDPASTYRKLYALAESAIQPRTIE